MNKIEWKKPEHYNGTMWDKWELPPTNVWEKRLLSGRLIGGLYLVVVDQHQDEKHDNNRATCSIFVLESTSPLAHKQVFSRTVYGTGESDLSTAANCMFVEFLRDEHERLSQMVQGVADLITEWTE